jgi:hypothetical protein
MLHLEFENPGIGIDAAVNAIRLDRLGNIQADTCSHRDLPLSDAAPRKRRSRRNSGISPGAPRPGKPFESARYGLSRRAASKAQARDGDGLTQIIDRFVQFATAITGGRR